MNIKMVKKRNQAEIVSRMAQGLPAFRQLRVRSSPAYLRFREDITKRPTSNKNPTPSPPYTPLTSRGQLHREKIDSKLSSHSSHDESFHRLNGRGTTVSDESVSLGIGNCGEALPPINNRPASGLSSGQIGKLVESNGRRSSLSRKQSPKRIVRRTPSNSNLARMERQNTTLTQKTSRNVQLTKYPSEQSLHKSHVARRAGGTQNKQKGLKHSQSQPDFLVEKNENSLHIESDQKRRIYEWLEEVNKKGERPPTPVIVHEDEPPQKDTAIHIVYQGDDETERTF
ncbi:DgyrCDS3406 [Dimorphilus gyrociliatus]|uniref:DgyrCDS3406 n=1 Tax=Dimorphilus gyrociliatus TaxID=2664684 RepID=A0A7I8VDL2_9ANNE|nr:DgyrCDS3406 [Dimorphilus gyrociliatus]